MKKVFLLFIFFLMLWEATISWGCELFIPKKIYSPGDKIKFKVSWEASETESYGLLYVTLIIPNGVKFYITPETLTTTPTPYKRVNVNRRGSTYIFEDSSLNYPRDDWFPQGRYTVAAWITIDEENAISDSSRWIGTKDVSYFTVTSHLIPLTYEDYDPRVRRYDVIKSVDGLWIIFICTNYSSEIKGRKIYATKIDNKGRTIIPPFYIASCISESCKPITNSFYTFPSSDGGFYLFVTEKEYLYGRLYTNMNKYLYDKDGNLKQKQIIFSTYKDDYYSVKWAYVDQSNNTTIVIAKENSGNLCLFIDNLSETRKYIIANKENYSGPCRFFKAYYDASFSELYILYGDWCRNEATFLKYSISGQLEISKDLPNLITTDYRDMGWPQDFFMVNQNLIVIAPTSNGNNVKLKFLDKQGNLVKSLDVCPQNDCNFYIYGNDAFHINIQHENNIVNMVWRAGSNEFYYSKFDLTGNIIIPPNEFKLDNTTGIPYFVNLGGYPFIILPADFKLQGYFIGYDFPLLKQDLVVSSPHVSQQPSPFAVLDSTTSFFVDVFNRGEKSSDPTSVKISYLGSTYEAQIPSIAPGDHYRCSFSIDEPLFLTDYPKIEGVLQANDYKLNNYLSTSIHFHPMTPIYPKGSQIYNWDVIDKTSLQPVKGAQVSYELKNITTVASSNATVLMTLTTDENGEFSTVLPNGDYKFYIQKHGYPRTIFSLNIPDFNSNVLKIEPPGDLKLYFIGSDGEYLHPSPQRVTASLSHQEDPSLSDWDKYIYWGVGSEEGLNIKDIMPGLYNCTINAFGYEPKTINLNIVGGATNEFNITLSILPRGNLTGRVVSSGHEIRNARVKIRGVSAETTTDSNGEFIIDDLPVNGDRYILEIQADGYQGKDIPFYMDSAQKDLGDINLKHIYNNNLEISKCRYAAWVQDVEWSDPENSYEIKTIYGVWDMSGKVSYQQVEDSDNINIDQISFEISPLLWNYAGLDGHVIEAFIGWGAGELIEQGLGLVGEYINTISDIKDWGECVDSFMVMNENLSNPLGTVKGAVVDCGQLDVLADLETPTSDTSPSDITLIRIDDVRIYDGDQVVFSTYNNGLTQYYSSEYVDTPLNIPVTLQNPISKKHNLKIKVYLRVMNGEYDTGPIELVGSKLSLEWSVKNNKLFLSGLIQNPYDYPSFEY